MYIDAIKEGDDIVAWTRGEDGKLQVSTHPAPYYCYQKCAESDLKSIFGDPVQQVSFPTYFEYSDFTESHGQLFESDISPLHKFLSDNYYRKDGPVHKGFYDIEVDFDLDDGRGYPTAEDPFGEVNSITLYNVKTKTYHIFMLHDGDLTIVDEDEGLPVVCYNCVTEKQLLDYFFREIDDIDVLTGWHSDGFDLPYIMARAMKLYGEDIGLTKMCRNGFKARVKYIVDDFQNERTKYLLIGRAHLDMMELYDKFTFEVAESRKLDRIAEKELGLKKREYEGDLGTLYRTDPKAFFDYSLHDVRLLKLLDEKMKLLDLAIKMSRQATIRYIEVLGSIKYLEHSIRNYAHYDRSEPVVLPDRNPHNEKKDFPGGYVVDTKAGLYWWAQTIDLASLYPSVIRMCNISPETHVLQCVQGHTAFIKVVEGSDEIIQVEEVASGDIHQIKASELKKIMEEDNLTISANGSLFDNTRQGLIPEVLSLWYAERKRVKKLAVQKDKEGDKEMAEYYDSLSWILKIGLNSVYGAMSNVFCRFFTLDCAKSITLTGQVISKYQSWKSDQLVSTA